jgi:hypothetical protein
MANMTRQPDAGRVREATAEATRPAGDAGAEMMRGGAEVAHRAAEATGDIARRGEAATTRMIEAGASRSASLAGGMQQRAAATAREAGTATAAGGEAMNQAMQAGVAEAWRMMLPGGTGSLRDMQSAMMDFYAEAMRTNLRMAQDMVRLMDPAGLLQGQQKAAHQMLDALLAAQSVVFGAARQAGKSTADAADRPR